MITLGDKLEKDKQYAVYIEVNGNEGYGDSDPYDCWESNFSGNIKCTKENITLTSELLGDLLNGNWVSYKFTKVEFVDVTDLSLKLEKMNKELDNFDWNNKTVDEYMVLSDKRDELNNEVYPNYSCSISINKTI